MSSAKTTTLRTKYAECGGDLLEEQITVKDPIVFFKQWLDEAKADEDILHPNAMCISTVSKSGLPHSRIILMDAVSDRGFTFYTNKRSPKAAEIEANPNVALNFHWPVKNRQVRIEGTATKLSSDESESEFRQRPRLIQVLRLAYPQSELIPNREYLDQAEREIDEKYVTDAEIPMANWSGYLVTPNLIEFTQAHLGPYIKDRIRFRRGEALEQGAADEKLIHSGENGWIYERLAP